MGNQPAVKTSVDLEQVNKIVRLLVDEFGDDITCVKFSRELLVALDVIYGPGGAAGLFNLELAPSGSRPQ